VTHHDVRHRVKLWDALFGCRESGGMEESALNMLEPHHRQPGPGMIVAARVDGVITDLSTPVRPDATVDLVPFDSSEGKKVWCCSLM
jgi:hypothetical protein